MKLRIGCRQAVNCTAVALVLGLLSPKHQAAIGPPQYNTELLHLDRAKTAAEGVYGVVYGWGVLTDESLGG